MSSLRDELHNSAAAARGNGSLPVNGLPDAARSAVLDETADRDLHQRLRTFAISDGDDALPQAAKLAALERQLTEDDAAAAAAGDAGSAILADLHDFRRICDRLGLTDSVKAVDRLTSAFLGNIAAAWAESVRPPLKEPSPERCFEALLQTSSLLLECLSQRSAAGVETLERVRDELRNAFLEAVAADPPTRETRRRWATELVDRADVVLTSLDESRPDCSAEQLQKVAGDLQWHLEHIDREPDRSRSWTRRKFSLLRTEAHRRWLRRKLARLHAERQERILQHRLEHRFGRRFVARSERVILLLILAVIAILLSEVGLQFAAGAGALAESEQLQRVIFWLDALDAFACSLFLTEFFVRLWYAPGRLTWFRRHFLFDLIPCVPYGFLLYGLAAPRTLSAARAALLGLRLTRGFGLLIRAFDRLARQYGHVLNRNVILYPTRAELERAQAAVPLQHSGARRLRLDLRHAWKRLLVSAAGPGCSQVAQLRLQGLETALERALTAQDLGSSVQSVRAREIPAGMLIEQLERLTPSEAEAALGEELVGQLAYVARTVARPPLRWFPIISSIAPRVTAEMTDAEVVSAAARRLAAVLRRFHNAYFWIADLYGTVSPSEFVDRVGTMLVTSSFRPAYRLLLFGGGLLLIQGILWLSEIWLLREAASILGRFLGMPIIVLGSVCILVLAVGLWLRRIAREATEFYERSAQAQFLGLTEMIRSRYLERDARVLYTRVLRPDWIAQDQQPNASDEEHLRTLSQRIEQSLLKAHAATDGDENFAGVETVVLLYRDWLDGAILADTDTRTTSQLLGNPAIRQFLHHSERIGRRQIKALQVLDLERQKSLFGGPYLWFNFISRSIAHSVACLLVDYNQHAIPLAELDLVSSAERDAYRRWLSGETAAPTATDREMEQAEERYVTTAFTALHFLDFDLQRDRQIAVRFGPQVLQRLQADRSLMIRRIFGTFPMHDRPKAERVVNLYTLYCSWLAGGRVILLPVFLLLRVLRFVVDLVGWIRHSIREIRNPDLRSRSRDAAKAHFLTAVRKIERIRGPVVYASMRLRMKFDPEYLGVPLAGTDCTSLAGADVASDVTFLRPDLEITEEVERERHHAQADRQRLQNLIDDGLLARVADHLALPHEALSTPAHLRAASCAYQADYRGVRRLLSAPEILSDVYQLAAQEPAVAVPRRPRPRLWRMFRRYWARHGFGGQRERRAAWSATVRNVWGVADALRTWDEQGDEARRLGERILADLMIHPGRLSEQLLALRTVQTLAVLDVLNYREHVYHLGRYAEMGDTAAPLLHWGARGDE